MVARATGLLSCLSLFAACGGGGADSSPSAPGPGSPPPPPQNSAPTISGTPATIVSAGVAYSFTPTASDADGDTLTFSIESPPVWAAFDASTGVLSGLPAAAHIGTTPGVTISVSDGTASASLAPFDLEVVGTQLGSATVSWDIPQTNADGSLLTDLAGFRVYFGDAPGNYAAPVTLNDATANAALIDGLDAGTWYFAVSAFDGNGNESALSDEVSKQVVP